LLLSVLFLSPQFLLPSIRYLQEGDKALLAGHYQRAAAYYHKALVYSDAKQKHLLWDDLGYAHLRLGDLKKSKDFLLQVISSEPENFDARLYLSLVYLLEGNQDAAFRDLNEIKNQIYFDNSWTWKSEEMDFYHPEGKRVQKDDWVELSRERGVYLEIKESPGERTRAFIHIDAMHESNEALLHFLRAVIFSSRGDARDAERAFLAARAAGYPLGLTDKEMHPEQLNPGTLSFSHRFRGHRTRLLREKLIEFQKILETGNLSAAVSVLYQALDIDAESFHANHNLALIYLDQAQLSENGSFLFEKAKRYCARALWYHGDQIVKKNDLISCMDLMANIYFQQNNFEAARNEYRKIIEMDPFNLTARYNLGCSYYNLGDLDKAETTWVQIVEQGEEAETETIQNEMDAEIHSLTITKTPILYLTHKALGNLYFFKKNYTNAVEILKKAVSTRPGTADPYFNLAVALAEEKQGNEAVEYMQTYIYLGGTRDLEARERLEKWQNK